MAAVAQNGISKTISLQIADIKTLNTNPVVVADANSGFINNFQRATVMYSYKSSVLVPTTDSLLGFYSGEILVSNQLAAKSIMGQEQSISGSFETIYPNDLSMGASVGNEILFKATLGDLTGGDSTTYVTVIITYDILKA